MINIILVDDHTIIRQGIKILLEYQSDIQIVAEASSGAEALKVLKQKIEVDIMLCDLNMPEMDGFTLLKEMKELYPDIKVIILTMTNKENDTKLAFAHGARGFMLKTGSTDEIIFAIKHVLAGKKYLCSELAQMFLEKSLTLSPEKLTNEFNMREVEILNLIAEGFTNSEMSERLFLSKRTIEGQRQALIEKTGTKNTAALVKFAIFHGIIN